MENAKWLRRIPIYDLTYCSRVHLLQFNATLQLSTSRIFTPWFAFVSLKTNCYFLLDFLPLVYYIALKHDETYHSISQNFFLPTRVTKYFEIFVLAKSLPFFIVP